MTLAVYLPNSFSNAAWIRYAAFLRLLKLLRLGTVMRFPTMLRFLYVIVSVEHIKIFFETFVAMLPAAIRLIKVRHHVSFPLRFFPKSKLFNRFVTTVHTECVTAFVLLAVCLQSHGYVRVK